MSTIGKKNPFLVCILLALLVSAVFLAVLQCDFINFDDPIYILDNAQVKSGIQLNNLIWAVKSFYASNWHPLTWISHMIDVEMFGLNAAGHHAVNLVFHVANTLLLWSFLRLTTGSVWFSMFAAALFGVHPMHIESVAWVSERKDVLSAFFLLLTLIQYARYVQNRSGRYLWASIIFYALGLMAKPMLVTLPLLLLLVDIWPLDRWDRGERQGDAGVGLRQLVLEKWPFWGLSLMSSLLTLLAQTAGGAVKSVAMIPLGDRIQNALSAYGIYLKKFVYPVNLAVFYPFPETQLFQAVVGAICIALIAWAASRFFRSAPWGFVGGGWFLISLLPVIGLVQVGEQAYADRYTYIPYIGLGLLTAWGGRWVLLRWPGMKNIIFAGVVLMIVSFSVMTHAGLSHWQNSESLFLQTLRVTENNHVAHLYLGNYYLDNGQFLRAEVHYQKVLELKPGYLDALVNLGVAKARLKKYTDALALFEKALPRSPDNPKIINNIGNIYKELGSYEKAAQFYKKALVINPRHKEALLNFADTLEKLDRFDEARMYYNLVLEIEPGFAEAYNGMGVVEARQGNLPQAYSFFKKAVDLKPSMKTAIENLQKVVQLLEKGNE